MTVPWRKCALQCAVATALASCETEVPSPGPTREMLPNGAVVVRYSDLPAIDSVDRMVTEAQVDLELGSLEGDDPNLIFGDIRGIQAASDGTIYVLDFQAAEVRAYDPGGQYLRTVVRGGEGPGEITEANGIILAGDTLLWLHDHGKWSIIGVDPAGRGVHRSSSHLTCSCSIRPAASGGRTALHTASCEPPPHLSAQPAISVLDSIVLQESGGDYLVVPGPVVPDGSGGYLVADDGRRCPDRCARTSSRP